MWMTALPHPCLNQKSPICWFVFIFFDLHISFLHKILT